MHAAWPPVVFVTPSAPLDVIIRATERAIACLPRGAFGIQFRDKASAPHERREAAMRIAEIAHRGAAMFIVNGDVDLARLTGAGGVHLGYDAPAIGDVRPRFSGAISVAAHTDEDVRRAAIDGADAVFVSPIFATPMKGEPRGVGAIVSARAVLREVGRGEVRVYALGGVDAAVAHLCFARGAHGVAVIRAIADARALFEASRAFTG